MNYEVEQLTLNVEGNRFVFKGKVERSDYSDLSKFLAEAEISLNGQSIEFDFRALDYLSSSGIRAVAVFLMGSDRKLIIRINPQLAWQNVGLTPLAAIKPMGMITVLA